LAVANAGPFSCHTTCGNAPGDVSIALGSGDGTLTAGGDNPVGIDPASLTRVDLNSDGRTDLAMVNQGSGDLSILFGNGDGTFAPETRLPAGSAPASLAVADLNGDGAIDLAVADRGEPGVSPGGVTLLFGSGSGTFTTGAPLPAGAAPSAVVA